MLEGIVHTDGLFLGNDPSYLVAIAPVVLVKERLLKVDVSSRLVRYLGPGLEKMTKKLDDDSKTLL